MSNTYFVLDPKQISVLGLYPTYHDPYVIATHGLGTEQEPMSFDVSTGQDTSVDILVSDLIGFDVSTGQDTSVDIEIFNLFGELELPSGEINTFDVEVKPGIPLQTDIYTGQTALIQLSNQVSFRGSSSIEVIDVFDSRRIVTIKIVFNGISKEASLGIPLIDYDFISITCKSITPMRRIKLPTVVVNLKKYNLQRRNDNGL
jgi:hypothetical protein